MRVESVGALDEPCKARISSWRKPANRAGSHQSFGVRQELTYLPIGDFGLDCNGILGRVADRSNRASYSLSKLATTLRN